jgi:hypothetical protein
MQAPKGEDEMEDDDNPNNVESTANSASIKVPRKIITVKRRNPA